MVILDVETFRYDLLVGIKDIQNQTYHFYWNSEAKPILEKLHEDQTVVINYNGEHYDLPLLYNYYFNKRNVASAFQLSKYIVEKGWELLYPKGFFNSIDLLFNIQNKLSLKMIEAILGWEIRETTIDFNYEFKLTEEQRREVEHYNKQDLDASEELYHKMEYYFTCRIMLANYLKIPHDYSVPLPTMMGMGLKAHRQPHNDIEISPLCYNIPIKHPIKDIMIKQMEKPDSDFTIDFTIQGMDYTIANGGIHSKLKCWSGYDVYHVDVKGYYSLLMINFDLFSRNIPPEGKKQYIKMYNDRLILKSETPEAEALFQEILKMINVAMKSGNPTVLADSLKLGLLAVWGATKNYHHILYDFAVGSRIPLYGELFLIWLIELFADNGIKVLNANTDGLIVKGDDTKIKELTKLWQEYGKFEVELVKYHRFVQKDVNSYIIGNSIDKLKVKGRDFTAIKFDWLFTNIVLVPQTPVIPKLLSQLLYVNEENGFDPENYVREHIRDFEVADYMFIINHTMKFEGMRFVETGEKLQRSNRVYASKNGYSVEKYREDNTYKYPGLPPCKMCNENLVNIKKEDLDIDYDWYVDEIMRKYVTYYG